MGNRLMAGVWRCVLGVPQFLWEKQIVREVEEVKHSKRFMSAEHRLVHHYVVRELPRYGKPIPPDLVARELGLAPERVVAILEDLERNLTFVYRDTAGSVIWAYPVTVERTPHSITFHSGEQLYAA
jgi:hypothetical protein